MGDFWARTYVRLCADVPSDRFFVQRLSTGAGGLGRGVAKFFEERRYNARMLALLPVDLRRGDERG